MSHHEKFRLTGHPYTRGKDDATQLVSVQLVAEREDGEIRSWHVREPDLFALFEVLPSKDLVAKLICDLRKGKIVNFPGNYNAMQLVLLGFRVLFEGMPSSAGIPTSLSTYARSDRSTRK
jgi:hypothetical protein